MTSGKTDLTPYKRNVTPFSLEEWKKQADYRRAGREIEKELDEEIAPRWQEKAKAGILLNLWGARTLHETAYGGLPENQGDIDYDHTPEFYEIIEANEITDAEDIRELRTSRNAIHLQAKIDRQKRYHEERELLESLSMKEQLLYNGIPAFFDPISWVVGGVVMKPFMMASTAYKVSKATTIGIRSLGTSVAAGTAVGLSEKLIQKESGIADNERLEDAVQMSMMFGAAIPLLPPLIGATSSGAKRVVASQGVENTLTKSKEGASFLKHFVVSTVEQSKFSKSKIVRDIAEKMAVPIRATKDKLGEFIPIMKNAFAMGTRERLDGLAQSIGIKNLRLRAKKNKTSVANQSNIDGKEYQAHSNQKIQETRAEVARLSDEEVDAIYKESVEETVYNKNQEAIDDIYSNLKKKVEGLKKKLAKAKGKKKSSIKGQITKAINKANKALYKIRGDMYDVVTNSLMKEKFEKGIYTTPEHLKYIEDFYTQFAKEGTEVKLAGLHGKHSGAYFNVKYNNAYLLSLSKEERVRLFKESLEGDALNQHLLKIGVVTEKDFIKEANRLADNIHKRDLRRDYFEGTYGKGASSLNQRVLRMNYEVHPEMFVNEIDSLMQDYAYKMSGRIALKKHYNIQTDGSGTISQKFNDLRLKMAEEGATVKDVENIMAALETLLGTRRMVKDPKKIGSFASRLLKKAASALGSAGFVLYGVIEPSVSIARFGWDGVANFIPAFKRAHAILNEAKPDDPLVKVMQHAGLALQRLRGVRYDRLDTHELQPSASRAELWLDKASHGGRKYSLFNYITDLSDMIAGGAAMDKLFTAVNKGTKTLTRQDRSQFARWGLSLDDVRAIRKQNVIYHKNSKAIKDYNLDEWADRELAEKVESYLINAVHDTVIRADGTRVHKWQSDVDDPLASMALQFTQVPTAMYERLLLSGSDELSIRTVIGLTMSTSIMYSILDLKDKADYVAGFKNERATDEELWLKAVMRTPFAGIVPNIVDGISLLSTGETVGSSFRPPGSLTSFIGAGLGAGNKMVKAPQEIIRAITEGEFSDRASQNFLNAIPILASMPLWKQGVHIAFGNNRVLPFEAKEPSMNLLLKEEDE